MENWHRLLGALQAPLAAETLQAMADQLAPDAATLQHHARFDDTGYTRNSLLRNEHVEVLLLCWKPGQQSPIHSHGGSRCAFKVLQGEATEVRYTTQGKAARLASVHHYGQGQAVLARTELAHQVLNNHPTRPLMTLHVYSPPLGDYPVYEVQQRQPVDA